jgi:1,2-phenylacetyl-CoA epoxidase catalytic subunit
VFENRVLRIFVPKREEMAGGWRRLHNEELDNLCVSLNVIRVIKRRKLAGHVAHMGEITDAYKILVGKPEGKRQFRRTRRRWEDNIRMDLREIGWEVVD